MGHLKSLVKAKPSQASTLHWPSKWSLDQGALGKHNCKIGSGHTTGLCYRSRVHIVPLKRKLGVEVGLPQSMTLKYG